MDCIAWLSSQEAPYGEVGEGEGDKWTSGAKTGFEGVSLAASYFGS